MSCGLKPPISPFPMGEMLQLTQGLCGSGAADLPHGLPVLQAADVAGEGDHDRSYKGTFGDPLVVKHCNGHGTYHIL